MTGSAYLCQAKRILQAGDELCHTRLNYAYRQRKKGYEKAARLWMKQAQQVPSINTRDPYFRWLKYVRYADGNFLKKEDVGERLHHADVRRYTFQRIVGEHLSSLSLLPLANSKTLLIRIASWVRFSRPFPSHIFASAAQSPSVSSRF